MNEYKLHTLTDGVRVLTVPRKDSPSVVAMVLVGVGSRYESDREAGISHFIEHNVFKGTKSRPNRGQVASEIEAIGGDMDAATSFEYTYYYAKAAAKDIDTILDVIMDVSANMIFPETDIEIERGNVLEEIRLVKDTPPRWFFKEYLDFVWHGSSLGRDILGTEKTVSEFSREQMLAFVNRAYTKNRIMVVVAGDFDENKVITQIENYYKTAEINEKSEVGFERFNFKSEQSRVLLKNGDNEQAHIALGIETFDKSDPRRFTLAVMNTILGEGFGGRLFKNIRDERGLAYYVGSGNWEFDDTGLWFSRAGVRIDKVDEAITAIIDEITAFKTQDVTKTELERAKAMMSGKTLLGVETADELSSWYGFQAMLEDSIYTPAEFVESIQKVSAEDIRSLAHELLVPHRLTIGVMGPYDSIERFEALVRI